MCGPFGSTYDKYLSVLTNLILRHTFLWECRGSLLRGKLNKRFVESSVEMNHNTIKSHHTDSCHAPDLPVGTTSGRMPPIWGFLIVSLFVFSRRMLEIRVRYIQSLAKKEIPFWWELSIAYVHQ